MGRKRTRADIGILFEERINTDMNRVVCTEIALNGMRLETVTDLHLSMDAETGPILTFSLLPTALDVQGPVEEFALVGAEDDDEAEWN